MKMANKQLITLRNLNLNNNNFTVIGIIIAKSNPRTIESNKKKGESRGVITFTLRDSEVDTINCSVWGSESFILNKNERILIGDVVEVTSPKISVKTGQSEIYRPHVSSPFILSVNDGQSEISLYSGDITSYLALLHIPTKPPAGYCGLAEILKFPEGELNVYVDLLVVVKSVKPVKTIKTKSGNEMLVRSIEVIDNTTPVSFVIDIFDLNDIQRAEEWIPLNSVLFVADARVCWRRRLPSLQLNSRSVVTHQPHTGDAEALRLYVHSQAERGGETAAWTEWSGECATTASVSQVRDRLAAGMPFCASLHAMLSHLNLDELNNQNRVSAFESQELHVRFSDHTGELSARLPVKILEQLLGYPSGRLLSIHSDERDALRWRILLEQCYVRLAVSPAAGLLVLSLRKATSADPIPLY